MRLTSPRIPTVEPTEWTEEQRALLARKSARGRPVKNIYKTLVQHPAARQAFAPWSRYVLSDRNTLGARDREILILRTGFLARCGYEWAQHVLVARRAGLTDDEISRVKSGPSAPGWSDRERSALAAADDLHSDQFISDRTWNSLLEYYTNKQCMDIVFTVGQYTLVSMFLNSFGVQLEPGQTIDPELRGG